MAACRLLCRWHLLLQAQSDSFITQAHSPVNDMNSLRWIILLQFTTISAIGQPGQSKAPGAPKQPEATVRSLYREVVARHPVGIPGGADKNVFAPYLSKSLLR